MANWDNLQDEIQVFKEEYFHRNRLAEQNRQKETQAAVRIQSWFRACRVRAYLSHLRYKVTIIQKIWRGFLARAHFRQLVQEAYFIMKMKFYNTMAIRIQSSWRGVYVRRYVHNYYARRRYLEGLAVKNELVRRELDHVEEYQRRERERMEQERRERDKIYQSHRLHHLISTKQCPGVYNSPFRPCPDQMELLLRRTRLRPSVPLSVLPGPRAPGCPAVSAVLCCSSRPLPSIPSRKPQGPFRSPEEVWRQRCRSLEPTVRVQTSYTHLEENQEQQHLQEVTRHVSDTLFLPFSRAHLKDREYERLLHGHTPFLPPAYGAKHFREEDTPRLRQKEPFKTTFSSCNVFEKFGRLYSRAGNID